MILNLNTPQLVFKDFLMNINKTKLALASAISAVALTASSAYAAVATNAAELATGVSFGDLTTALYTIAGLILGFVIVSKGVSLVIGFVRRG